MGLLNLGVVPSSGGTAALTLSAAQTVSEGSGADTALAYTLTLVRNGVSGAVPFSWSVTGRGANPASASDFAGGTWPGGSGTFAAGETTKTLTLTIAGDTAEEADEGFAISVTASVPLAATGMGTIRNDDGAGGGGGGAPAALLMGSRFNQMGYGGATSNGTDQDSNSRIASYNETGATVTKLRAYFTNWLATATNEADGSDPITVTAAIEYPAGTITPLTFAGAASVTIPAAHPDNLVESDEAVPATPIPAGALYWVRTYVTVAAGAKWVQGYIMQPGSPLLEAADFATGVSKVGGGTITNATATGTRRGYGPSAVKATGFSGTPVAKAFAGVGDSLIFGASDQADAATVSRGNLGYFGKACAGSYPYVNLGFSGTKAFENLPAAFVRRAALLSRIGITHVFCNWSVNDTNAGRTVAQQTSDIGAIASGLKSAIPQVKVVYSTQCPSTTSSDGWKTVAGQAPKSSPSGAFTGGAGSRRAQVNAALRGGIGGVDILFDAADVAESARDSGLWRAADGSTHLTATGAATDAFTADGVHPVASSTTSPGYGGVYALRDAVKAVFAGW